jgi:hypothetical protein
MKDTRCVKRSEGELTGGAKDDTWALSAVQPLESKSVNAFRLTYAYHSAYRSIVESLQHRLHNFEPEL